nr:transposase [Desulfobacula sp.]
MEEKMEMTRRRKFDRDFKRNAVLLSQEPGRSVPDVAENLGIRSDSLYRWRREYFNKDGRPAFPGNGREALTEDQRRIKELEKELRDTQMERDILKKPWPSSAEYRNEIQIPERKPL